MWTPSARDAQFTNESASGRAGSLATKPRFACRSAGQFQSANGKYVAIGRHTATAAWRSRKSETTRTRAARPRTSSASTRARARTRWPPATRAAERRAPSLAAMSAICTGSTHDCWKTNRSLGDSHTTSAGASRRSAGSFRPERSVRSRSAMPMTRSAVPIVTRTSPSEIARRRQEDLERRIDVRDVVANDARRRVDDGHRHERVLPLEQRPDAVGLHRPHVDVRDRRSRTRLEARERRDTARTARNGSSASAIPRGRARADTSPASTISAIERPRSVHHELSTSMKSFASMIALTMNAPSTKNTMRSTFAAASSGRRARRKSTRSHSTTPSAAKTRTIESAR